jgi:hypothetical protein
MGKLSKVNNGGRERGKWANPSLKKGMGIYTPPRIVAVAVLQGPDIPVQVWTGYSAPLEKLLRTSRVSFRFGAGYFQNWAGYSDHP